MPYIINNKGLKIRYSPTKISEKLTHVYNNIYGENNSIYYRSEIIELTSNIIKIIEKNYGEGEDSKWDLEVIEEIIYSYLDGYKNSQILKTYKLLYPIKIKQKIKELSIEEISDSNSNTSFFSQKFEIDPIWSIKIENKDNQEKKEEIIYSKMTEEIFGNDIRSKKNLKRSSNISKKQFIEKKRSDWFNWLKTMSLEIKNVINLALLEKIASKENKPYSFDSEGWYKYWKEVIFEAIIYDPRFFDLLRLIQNKRKLSFLIGRDWLDGSGLNQKEDTKIIKNPILNHLESEDLYRLLWKKNIERLLEENKLYSPISSLNLDKISLYLKPERDLLISWHGYQILKNGGCLWTIPQDYKWKVNLFVDLKTDKNSVEPIQWVWMRLAMSISLLEKNPEEYIEKYYNLFSQLIILPSESMLRQAGMKAPDYLEDMATRLEDKFETIYESINKAAIGTKWTGSVSIDWSKVRSVGSPIGNGIRHSKGVMQFSKLLNEAMIAQNRIGEDKPITISLPIWHKEIIKFIKEKDNLLPRLKGVINVSDLFMERLLKNEDWLLFDPAFYPNVNNRESYLYQESLYSINKEKYPNSILKINSIKLWNRILKGLRTGMYTIVFEDSNKAFDILPDLAPSVSGMDGVGCFPLPLSNDSRNNLPWVSWPSASVNLLHCIKTNGEPDIEKLSNYVYLALRLLDNSLTITANKEDKETLIYRSVCLGNIGFNEALEEIITTKEKYSTDENILQKWISGLSEAWGLAVLKADQSLAKERGVAPVYEKALKYTRFYSPENSLSILKEKRKGNLNIEIESNPILNNINSSIKNKGYRFVNRSCWAPFKNSSIIAGVSPGGVGVSYPISLVEDDEGIKRWVPNPNILRKSKKNPESMNKWNLCLKYPTLPRMWDENIKKLSNPSPKDWKDMIDMAKRARVWSDQGVSLTLPVGLSVERLNILITESWWSGLNVIRFEKRIKDLLNFESEEYNEEDYENKEDLMK